MLSLRNWQVHVTRQEIHIWPSETVTAAVRAAVGRTKLSIRVGARKHTVVNNSGRETAADAWAARKSGVQRAARGRRIRRRFPFINSEWSALRSEWGRRVSANFRYHWDRTRRCVCLCTRTTCVNKHFRVHAINRRRNIFRFRRGSWLNKNSCVCFLSLLWNRRLSSTWCKTLGCISTKRNWCNYLCVSNS